MWVNMGEEWIKIFIHLRREREIKRERKVRWVAPVHDMTPGKQHAGLF